MYEAQGHPLADDIRAADSILPGVCTDKTPDLRWQAIIAIGDHVREEPEPIWEFVLRWGSHPDDDLRDAIACVLVEHLLEYHFDLIFPRVEQHVRQQPLFADMFCRCWKFGQAGSESNARRFDELQSWCHSILGAED